MTGEILAPAFTVEAAVVARAARVRLAIFDVDGVLTDGRLFLGDDGQEYKAFHSRDGHGIKMLQRNGVEVGIITGRTSKVVDHRMADLGVKHLFQGCRDKLPVYLGLVQRLGLDPGETAFIGDDVVDLPIMLQAGLAVAVQDAHALVRRHAHWVTPSRGGLGAAREACEMILHARGVYAQEMLHYL